MEIKIQLFLFYMLEFYCSTENNGTENLVDNITKEIDVIISDLDLNENEIDPYSFNTFLPDDIESPITELDGKDLERYFNILESLLNVDVEIEEDHNLIDLDHHSSEYFGFKIPFFDNFKTNIKNMERYLKDMTLEFESNQNIGNAELYLIQIYDSIKKDFILHDSTFTYSISECVDEYINTVYESLVSSKLIIDIEKHKANMFFCKKNVKEFYNVLFFKIENLFLNKKIDEVNSKRSILQEKERLVSKCTLIPEINYIDLLLFKKNMPFIDHFIIFFLLRIMNIYVEKNDIDSKYDYKLYFFYKCLIFKLKKNCCEEEMILEEELERNPCYGIRRMVLDVLDPYARKKIEKVSDDNLASYLSTHKTITFRIFLIMNLYLYNKWFTLLTLADHEPSLKIKYKKIASSFFYKNFKFYSTKNKYFSSERLLLCCLLIHENFY